MAKHLPKLFHGQMGNRQGVKVAKWKNNEPSKTNKNLENISQYISKFPSVVAREVQNKVQNTYDK